MTPDRLLLSPEGEQALLTAEQGGVYIRPRSFSIGDFQGTEPSTVPSGVLGTDLFSGTIHYIEVVSANTARFTLVVPSTANTTPITVTEAVVRLDDGTTLGRVRFTEPVIKNPGRGLQIQFLLHLSQANAHVIDVTLSEFGSVPSVVGIDSLPAASTAITNAVVVLDLQQNPTGDFSPELAYRFGAGGSVWGFSGYGRLFTGLAGPDVTSTSNFSIQSVIDDYELEDGDLIIVNISAGAGAGETRRFTVSGSEFTAVNAGFTDLDSSSAIHIWKQITSVSGGAGLPSRDGVGADWQLVAGPANGSPQWVPNAGGRSRTRGNLYHPPGKLNFQALAITPTEAQKTFYLFNEDPLTAGVDESQMRLYSFRRNNNYATIALSGVSQHRAAFEITNNKIEFAENIPVEVDIDARLYELQPHPGMYTSVVSRSFVGDGSTRIFDLPADVENIFYTKIYVERILTEVASYSIDAINKKVTFSEPPQVGAVFEINCFVQEEIAGYSTQVITTSISMADLNNIIPLPVVPQSKDLVFISESGAHVNKDEYAVVGNKVVMRVDFVEGRDIEVVIFHNIRAEGTSDTGLRGMVLDGIATARGYEFNRHNAEPIRVPFPDINWTVGRGINITGKFPNFTIESTVAERIARDKFERISQSARLEDSDEIIITKRIEFKDDVLIMVTADFEAKLGPGFKTTTGLEEMQYVVGFKTVGSKEPDYARSQIGTGDASFGISDPSKSNLVAKSNASQSQTFTILAENNTAGYIDIVAKMRVKSANVSEYGSMLRATLSGIIIPMF